MECWKISLETLLLFVFIEVLCGFFIFILNQQFITQSALADCGNNTE